MRSVLDNKKLCCIQQMYWHFKQYLNAFRAIVILLFIIVSLQGFSQQSDAANGNLSPCIVRCECGNLAMEDLVSEKQAVLKLTSPVHNWFLGKIDNIPDHEITFGFTLDSDTGEQIGDVSKWVGLRAMMSYSDPERYETYEIYNKSNDGHWYSTDIFKPKKATEAGTGKVPTQQLMSPDVAEKFISDNGKTWFPWCEIDTEIVPGLNVCRFRNMFSLKSATVAMRIPFPYVYYHSFVMQLMAASLKGVFIDECGKTKGGKEIYVIRIEDLSGAKADSNNRTVLMVSGEHATEYASSWVNYGALLSLLRDTDSARELRKNTTWLFVIIEDPDGNVNPRFDRLTDMFDCPNNTAIPDEVDSYKKYFTNFVSGSSGIDLAVSLHNVEVNECANIYSPVIDPNYKEIVVGINNSLFNELKANSYQVGAINQPWSYATTSSRLFGWCTKKFGALPLAYEVNDRYPSRRMSLTDLQRMGEVFALQLGRWVHSEESKPIHEAMIKKTFGK